MATPTKAEKDGDKETRRRFRIPKAKERGPLARRVGTETGDLPKS